MRTKIALLAAIILGLFAAIGVQQYVTQREKEQDINKRKVQIVLAQTNLNAGSVLNATDAKVYDVDAPAVTDSHILASEAKQYFGQRLTRKVSANQPLLKEYFMTPNEAFEFAPKKVDVGMRAVTIGTDQISGVAGLLIPGCSVDILGTFRTKSGGPEAGNDIKTGIVARNVTVLAIDNQMDVRVPVRAGRQTEVSRGYSSLTLHVTPAEASLLVFAQSVGKLTFILRNPKDDLPFGTVQPTTPTTFDQDVAAAGRIREDKLKGRTGTPERPPAPAPN